jgi:sugar/nucleoside kinase (ribokinase family)
MKKTLVIGSTTLDIIINVPALPSRKDDVNIRSQTVVLGGCAYNIQSVLRLAGLPHVLCSPVGSGLFGDYVFRELAALGIDPFIRIETGDNGCCYCYVEPDGERTFIAYHGVEYTFSESWMKDFSPDEIDGIYACGLEIEEPTGSEIISWLEHVAQASADSQGPVVYFAAGPRITTIETGKLERMFALHPVMHLNREELLAFTGGDSLESGARLLFGKTGNTVIVTDGAEGSYCFDRSGLFHAPSIPVTVVDTIGAGDSHMGAVIACRKRGLSWQKSLEYANKVAAEVVAIKGATLTEEIFRRIPAPEALSGTARAASPARSFAE